MVIPQKILKSITGAANKDIVQRQIENQCNGREIGLCLAEQITDGIATCDYSMKHGTFDAHLMGTNGKDFVIHGTFNRSNGRITSANGELGGYIFADMETLCSKSAGWGQETIVDKQCVSKATAAVEAEAKKIENGWRNAVIPEWCINFETE
ncbi:MAG: hypothetical protein LBQ76_02010 [Candidatus Fibromonas sp.]|nr:hypothetical protein [Candidatus Fibromonas sp.]